MYFIFQRKKTNMSRLLLFFSLFALLGVGANAQKSIAIQFNHALDGAPFALDKLSKNDLGDDFKIQRLDYYLSNFSIQHDGGKITNIDGLYFLMKPGTEQSISTIDLGTFDFGTVEGVRFHFGIDNETNHADPAQWPEDHALAPKLPSMHWGWASGYRFIALEGKSGIELDQALEFHCIGDEFYEEMSFSIDKIDQSSYIAFVRANYEELLDGIELENGVIQHGNLGDIKTLASNIIDKVFVDAFVSNTSNDSFLSSIVLSPNPSLDGYVQIQTDHVNASVHITDIFGRKVGFYKNVNEKIFIPNKGMYWVSLISEEGVALATEKIIVQ